MITKVMGRVTDTYWSVEENCHIDYESKKLIFDAKPEIKKNVVDCDPIVICEYDGSPVSSHEYVTCCWEYGVFIDGEFVAEQGREFHADIPEWRQYVDKVVKNIDYDMEETKAQYKELIREYNAYVINGDERLLAYCKLHNLDIKETDPDELKKILPSKTSDTISVNVSPPSFTIYPGYYASSSIASSAVISN